MAFSGDKFVKRIQSRLSSQGCSFTKEQIRTIYAAVVKDPENPSEEEMTEVMHKMRFPAEPETVESSTEEGLVITADNTIEITPESNPDIWETLQPTVIEESLPESEPSDLPSNLESEPSALTKAEETKAVLPTAGGIIPQDEVKGMVSQVFADQPQEFTNQVTEYALQHSFENVRQIQEFLEQLRGMEFNLLVQTLNDHVNRRGSMLTVLNQVLDSQRQQDQENRDSFFGRFQSQLTSFQREMQEKLSKQSL